MAETTYASADLFTGKNEVVLAIYSRLLQMLHTLGPVKEDLYSPGS